MLTLKARNTYNNIDALSGRLTGGARPQKGGILAGNDILNGMTGQLAGVATSHPGMQGGKYSFKNFAHDVGKAEKTVAKVGTNTGNQLLKSVPGVITKSFEGAVVPALSKYGSTALTNYLMPAAETAVEYAPLALAAAGRSDLPKGSKKAKSHMNNIRGVKLVKGSQQAKDFMAKLRSLRVLKK